MRRFAVLIAGSLLCSPLACAEPSPIPDASELSLEKLILEYEAAEKELAQAREALKTAPTASERRRIEAWIQRLQQRQQELVEELEKKVGPLPPAVRDQPVLPPEKRMESQRLRDEAVLEKDVERRLPQ